MRLPLVLISAMIMTPAWASMPTLSQLPWPATYGSGNSYSQNSPIMIGKQLAYSAANSDLILRLGTIDVEENQFHINIRVTNNSAFDLRGVTVICFKTDPTSQIKYEGKVLIDSLLVSKTAFAIVKIDIGSGQSEDISGIICRISEGAVS